MTRVESVSNRHYGGHPQSGNVKSIKKTCQKPASFDEFYKAAIAKEMKGVKEDA
jgi:hypothetical protein